MAKRVLIAPPRSQSDLENYIVWVQQCGHVPVILQEGDQIKDPLLLCGGSDIGKNQERDLRELEWIRQAIDNKQPIIGVCRGMQIVNYFFGGKVKSMDEDLTEDHRCDDFSNDDDHSVRLSQFHWVMESTGKILKVNSRHHQYCSSVAENFKITHFSVGAGNIPEGIEDLYRKIWAVQWHPERFESDDNQYPLNMI